MFCFFKFCFLKKVKFCFINFGSVALRAPVDALARAFFFSVALQAPVGALGLFLAAPASFFGLSFRRLIVFSPSLSNKSGPFCLFSLSFVWLVFLSCLFVSTHSGPSLLSLGRKNKKVSFFPTGSSLSPNSFFYRVCLACCLQV